MSDSYVILRTYKYRLYPSKRQVRNLFNALNCARSFYNMCVGERKWSWELERRSVTKNEQFRQVKHYKHTFLQAQNVHSHIFQVAAADCDKAFQSFFRRVKAGETPGYPRFKGYQRFHSFGLKEYGNGWKLDGRKLKLSGIGRVSVRWHRRMEGTPKTLRIIHRAGKWYAAIASEVTRPEALPTTGRAVGIDVGISALITTSDGHKLDNPNFYRTGQQRLRVLQRKLARARCGSNNRRKALKAVQRQHAHVANQRCDFLHKLSTDLVQSFDRIALEDLIIRNMVRSKHLSKSILDSGWSMFRQFLTYKAESAGREVAFVDDRREHRRYPRYTSMCCSNCGKLFEDFDLSVRWVKCGRCGLSMDRDHNAAINILKRTGWDTAVLPNVGAIQAERAAEATRIYSL